VTTPINDSIFANSNSLVTWWFRTYKKTTGPLPLFVGCPNLKTIVAPSNSFSGNLPNFATTPLIYHINLSDNNFSGKIPSLSNLKNLRFLFLQNNSFTSLDPFSNLPRLKFFYAFNNNIKGLLPDFSSCLLLRGLYLYNNQFDDYQSGYLSNNYNLKYLLLQNNNFSQTAINKIIGDLYDNYTNFNKTGLVVNLRGNAPPGGEETLEKLLFLKTVAKWSITTD
jgi:Leucine-rich repeat (LRR) protein